MKSINRKENVEPDTKQKKNKATVNAHLLVWNRVPLPLSPPVP